MPSYMTWLCFPYYMTSNLSLSGYTNNDINLNICVSFMWALVINIYKIKSTYTTDVQDI